MAPKYTKALFYTWLSAILAHFADAETATEYNHLCDTMAALASDFEDMRQAFTEKEQAEIDETFSQYGKVAVL